MHVVPETNVSYGEAQKLTTTKYHSCPQLFENYEKLKRAFEASMKFETNKTESLWNLFINIK